MKSTLIEVLFYLKLLSLTAYLHIRISWFYIQKLVNSHIISPEYYILQRLNSHEIILCH